MSRRCRQCGTTGKGAVWSLRLRRRLGGVVPSPDGGGVGDGPGLDGGVGQRVKAAATGERQTAAAGQRVKVAGGLVVSPSSSRRGGGTGPRWRRKDAAAPFLPLVLWSPLQSPRCDGLGPRVQEAEGGRRWRISSSPCTKRRQEVAVPALEVSTHQDRPRTTVFSIKALTLPSIASPTRRPNGKDQDLYRILYKGRTGVAKLE